MEEIGNSSENAKVWVSYHNPSSGAHFANNALNPAMQFRRARSQSMERKDMAQKSTVHHPSETSPQHQRLRRPSTTIQIFNCSLLKTKTIQQIHRPNDQIQVPDVSWNAPFKNTIRELHSDWMLHGDKPTTSGGNLRAHPMEIYLE
uniref:Uncharacterized protein n=1 Tax=Globodera rostochiensis TaxID=31243 RepID=A0A914HTV8_GLORO